MSAKVNKGWIDETTGATVTADFEKPEIRWAFEALATKLATTKLPADAERTSFASCRPSEFMLMCKVIPVGFGVATRYQFKHYATRQYIEMHGDFASRSVAGWTFRKGAFFAL